MEQSKYILNPGDSLIIETRQNDNGEYVIVDPQFQFSGVISASAFITIHFRSVSNGTILSDWQLVGTQTVASKKHNFSYSLGQGQALQIKFTRSQDNVSGSIEFVKFYTEDSTYTLLGRETPTLDASMFSSVNLDKSTTDLENNLFKKLYYRGIVPNYIERGRNRSLTEDADYVILFSTIALTYSLSIS